MTRPASKSVQRAMLSTKGRTLNFAAPVYDWCQEHLYLGRDRRARERLVELLGVPHAPGGDRTATAPPEEGVCGPREAGPLRVLDLGCATGNLTLDVARRLGASGRCVGIDAAPKMVAHARRKAAAAGQPAEFREALAEDLPFEDNAFDAVVSSFFFHHLPLDLKRRSFAEAVRVLKPGAGLAIVDVDRPTHLWGWLVGYASFVLLVQKPIYENLRGVLPGLMAEAGLRDVVRVDHWYGLVSFYTARKPARPG